VRRPMRASLTCGLLAVALTGCARDNRVNLPGYDPSAAEVGAAGAVVLYVLLPLAIALIVAALAWLPGMVRSSRYRPGAGWSAAPVWFAGPPDPAAAVEAAETGELNRGGASGSW
jgi:hypothetical protein